ncbi:hypothetical protein HDV01_001770 [Terramyces sp. JEL0728]|nr:hypothetical protein HDV01_001770 [Terramyces sp. JEL0728]
MNNFIPYLPTEDDPATEAAQKAINDWIGLAKSTQNCGIDQQVTKYLDNHNPLDTRIRKSLETSHTEIKKLLDLTKSIELKSRDLQLISKEFQ